MTSEREPTPVRTFTTPSGRTWLVRVLPVGARYGRTGALLVAGEWKSL